jgi:hypothetical protein
MNRHNLLILLTFLFAPIASAGDPTVVYRSVGDYGVVTFSDTKIATTDEVMLISTVPAREDELARAALQFEQQLALIEILERSRREREASQLEREKQRVELARARADLERSSAPVYVNQGGGYFRPYYATHYKKRHHQYRGHRDKYYASPHGRPGSGQNHGGTHRGRLSPTRTLNAPFPAR